MKKIRGYTLGSKLLLKTILGTQISNNNLGEKDNLSNLKISKNSETDENNVKNTEVNRSEGETQVEREKSDLQIENNDGNKNIKEVNDAPGK